MKLVFASAALFTLASAGVSQPPGKPVISNLTVESNIVTLHVTLPSGFTNSILEARTNLSAEWQKVGEEAVARTGGDIIFRLPKRGDMLFLRVVGINPEGQNEFRELNFLSGAKLIAEDHSDRSGKRIALHFKAFIDGLDTIQLDQNGIRWNHVRYKNAEQVSLNGKSWNPAEVNFIDFGSSVNGDISWPDTRLSVIAGRDIVALEKQPTGAVVHVYDTPWGADKYEFTLYLQPRKSQPSFNRPAKGRLHIRAIIDGTDQLIISRASALWTHKQWGWPSHVDINGVSWSPQDNAVLKSQLLPNGVDFQTARIVSKSGRGFANLEPTADDLRISFADDEDGAAPYELEIELGR